MTDALSARYSAGMTPPSVAALRLFRLIRRGVARFRIPVESAVQDRRLTPFQTLVAFVLSSRTRDETTVKVMERLSAAGLRGPEDFLRIPLRRLEFLVRPCGFYRAKARHLRALAKAIRRRPLPSDLEGLLALPGVGRKVANLFLARVTGQPAIAVDTHVFRIANRLWFHDRPARTAEEAERRLAALFPRRIWRQINSVLVKFGRNICLPRRPRCPVCPVRADCPSRSELESPPRSRYLPVVPEGDGD